METALKIQRDIKNNNQDLQNYMLDLNNWEEEMKRKEKSLSNEQPHQSSIPPPRNKIKRTKPEGEKNISTKPNKISAYDYSAWDKFDVDKACAELDKEDQDEETEEEEEEQTEENSKTEENDDKDNKSNKNLSLIDEAFYEKELGNQFVKKEQWADAIRCYTKAINLDSKNAIYYANRSLCFLKIKNFKSAEVDATVAIQLDKNYVKAYQRRAFARLALGQLAEAKSDYEEVLKIEPKNALARVEINKIDEKLNKDQKISKPVEKKTFNHKDIFKTVENKAKPSKVTEQVTDKKEKAVTDKKLDVPVSKDCEKKTRSVTTIVNRDVSAKKEEKNVEKGDGDKEILHKLEKSDSQVFKPLPDYCTIVHPVDVPPHRRSKKPLKRIQIVEVDTDEDFEVSTEPKPSRSNVDPSKTKEIVTLQQKAEDYLNNERVSFEVPTTSIQFQKSWKVIKRNPEEAYSYLKKIPGKELPQILENSLESDFFSELVTFLASDQVKKDPELMYDFLLGLSNVKRFSSLVLFMSRADKECVKKCLEEVEKIKSKQEISELFRLYEL